MQKREILVIYQSSTDGTRQLVNAFVEGARASTQIAVTIQLARDTLAGEMARADAYVFATPEYLGAMGGLMKDLFDRTYYDLLDQLQGRPYTCLICAGSDGHGAARQLTRIATGWRLKAVADPLIVNVHAQTPSAIQTVKRLTAQQLKPCHELGLLFSSGLEMGIF